MQLSEHGQNSASVLVKVLADPKRLFRGLMEFQEFQVKSICAYVFGVSFSRSYSCFPKEKGDFHWVFEYFLGGPPTEKSISGHCVVVLPWVSPRGEKCMTRKVPGSIESSPLASHRTLSFLPSFPMESGPSICLSNLPLDTAIQARFSPWMHSLCERGFSPRMRCLYSLMPESHTKTSTLGRSFTDIPTCLFSVTFG